MSIPTILCRNLQEPVQTSGNQSETTTKKGRMISGPKFTLITTVRTSYNQSELDQILIFTLMTINDHVREELVLLKYGTVLFKPCILVFLYFLPGFRCLKYH